MPRGGVFRTRKERNVVVGEDRQSHVRKSVPDFSALIEAEAAQQPVANRSRAKHLFQRPGLRVGPIHHRAMRRGVVALQLADAIADVFRFCPRVPRFIED